MRDLGVGFRYLLKGQRWVARHGRQYGFGLLPGLITLVLYAAALVALALWGEDAVAWATPFADDWSSPWLGLFRGFLTAVLFALALLLAVVTFTAVTLLVGQPFYENLSEKVDRDVSPDGHAPESGLPLWRELWISARDSLRIVVRAALWGRAAVRVRVRPGRRADGRPGDRVLRHRVLPHRGTDRRRPPAPRRGTAYPPHPALFPQDPRMGLRHTAGRGLPGAVRG
ncbi:integral membrane protein, partial [Streptomyces viridochromogenes DSM 40736]